jgi:electron transfer flavoprotein beta subunit
MKQVPDPEGAQASFVVDREARRVEPRGIPPVLSLFDENALEAALRVKEAQREGDAKVTVISVGKRLSNAVLQKALAAGADDVVKVEDERLDPAALDSRGAAYALAAVIKTMGKCDLIFTGRQAADWNAGQVGIGIAHFLGIPAVTLVRKVDVQAGHAIAERVTANGYEVVQTPIPAVFVVSNEAGELRYPTLLQRRDARAKPVVSLGLAEVDVAGTVPRRLVLRRLFAAEVRVRQCQVIEAVTPAEAGRKLAQRLRSDGLI